MSTVSEIERAIEQLPPAQMLEVAAWLDERRKKVSTEPLGKKTMGWPVPPPNVPREELERIEAEIEAAFPTKRG